MTTPESPDITILELSPPRAPGATAPVIGAHYGVPKHVYDLKPMGLRIDIDPPLAGTVSPGDVIALVLNGQSVASKPINPGEENAVNTLYIPKGLLLTDRLNELVYTITRGSQNIGTSTPMLTLLYNTIRPGMEDRTPGDGAHSELELILPQDVIEDGIDADRAKQGVQVCFSYLYCRAHDRIWLNCNGQDVYRSVTIAEAPAIPSAEPTTICVMVEEAVFERAGDHPNFTFSYTVTDQLGNGPDTDSPWSGPVLVDVHRNETRLVAPDLAEDPDDPSDDPRTIDLSKLGKKDLTVLVHTFAPQWQPNDKIRVTYSATPASGSVVEHTVEADVARIPFTYKLMVPNAKVIAGSVVRAKYELVRNGMVITTSKTTIAEVSGAGSVDLLPPFLVKPAVSPIDALAYPDGVTVRVEYLGALDGDKARLVEVNAPAGSPQFPLVAFNSNKRTNTVLTQAFLIARQGTQVELRWNLNRDGSQAGKSPVTTVSVKIVDLVRDVTEFKDENWNDWVPTTPSDWRFFCADNNCRINNITRTNSSDGVVLSKSFNTLRVDGKYLFSIDYARYLGQGLVPRISLMTGTQTIAGPVNVDNMNYQTLSGTFIASTPSTVLSVVSHVASGNGNDYEFDNIKVELVS